jgi:hypothetical protein
MNARNSQAVHQAGHDFAVAQGLAAGGVEFYRAKQWTFDKRAYNHPKTYGLLTRLFYGFHGLLDQPSLLRQLEAEASHQA